MLTPANSAVADAILAVVRNELMRQTDPRCNVPDRRGAQPGADMFFADGPRSPRS